MNLDPVTWEKYTAFLKHLNNFQAKVYLGEVDVTLNARIKNYLANQKGRNGKMDPVTIRSYFDKFKVVLNHAAKKDRFLDPTEVESFFEEVKISAPKRKEGLHLDIEDMQQLRKLEFNSKEFALRRDRDLFLLQIYTGFYYVDLFKLRKDQLFTDVEYGYYIISERDKNDNPTIIPVFNFPTPLRSLPVTGIIAITMITCSGKIALSRYRLITGTCEPLRPRPEQKSSAIKRAAIPMARCGSALERNGLYYLK